MESDKSIQEIARKVRGEGFVDAEPITNAEAAALLRERQDALLAQKDQPPKYLQDTINDISMIYPRTTLDIKNVEGRKDKLRSFVYEDGGVIKKLDDGEICQIINLNPENQDEVKLFIPTLERFTDYYLERFVEDRVNDDY